MVFIGRYFYLIKDDQSPTLVVFLLYLIVLRVHIFVYLLGSSDKSVHSFVFNVFLKPFPFLLPISNSYFPSVFLESGQFQLAATCVIFLLLILCV